MSELRLKMELPRSSSSIRSLHRRVGDDTVVISSGFVKTVVRRAGAELETTLIDCFTFEMFKGRATCMTQRDRNKQFVPFIDRPQDMIGRWGFSAPIKPGETQLHLPSTVRLGRQSSTGGRPCSQKTIEILT